MAHTQLPEIKRKILGTVFELLAGKPEQEQQLLSMICNKMVRECVHACVGQTMLWCQ
eukprot:m.737973 g.737973  ORF g.737973 m.737973 type:complete len:57 (-) comp23098_c1_seq79:2563-2733(-)